MGSVTDDSAESKAPVGSASPAAAGAPSDERPQKPVLAASDAAPTAILSSPAPLLPSAPPAPPKPQLSASEAAELFAAAPEPVTPQYRRSSPPPAPVDTSTNDTAPDDTAPDDATRPVWQQPTSLLPTVTPADDSAVAPGNSEQHEARPSVNDDRTEVLQLPDASNSGSRADATSAGHLEEPARRVVFSKKWPFIALVDAPDAGVAAKHTAAEGPAESVQPEAASSETAPADAARVETSQSDATQSDATQSEAAQPGSDALPGAAATNEPEIELTDEEIAAFGADPSWVDTESPLVHESPASATPGRDEDSADAVDALFGTIDEPANTTSEASLVDARELARDGDPEPVAAPAGFAAADVDEEQEAAIDAIAVDAPEAHATPLGLIDSAASQSSIDEERRTAGAPSYAAGSGVLSVSGLSKRFGDTVAVDGIDLEVSAGSFYGIVGPNGAGKTTTLSMITGLLRPDSGSITINGIDVWKEPDAAKRSIGVLPDHLRLFDRLTGSQLLYYSGVLRGIDGATVRSRVDDLAKAFGLEDALHRLVTDYSAGMTKKVALAAAMIHSPRMLVLDEPFESVDPVSAANVIEILQKYVDHGGTVVLSSHGMDLIQRVCDHVAIIVNGQVLAQGSVDEVRGTGTLEERFVELAGGRKAAEGMEWLHSFSD
jgi:ABC-type multidrug transport system ATPase subunit